MILPLEKQVTSLELSRRLKELGVRQEALYSWRHNGGALWRVMAGDEHPIWERHFAAFTVAELGEMLRWRFGVPMRDGRIDQSSEIMFNAEVAYWIRPNRYEVGLKGEGELLYAKVSGDTEADARAKMLIHLIEKGLVKP